MDSAEPTGRLRALDPNLPFLAARAAIELDNIMLRRSATTEAISALAFVLRSSTELNSSSQCSLLDPITVETLTDALSETHGKPITTIAMLVEQARALVVSLMKASEVGQQDDQRLRELRLFCIALSRITSSHLQANYESSRSQHPHRV